MPETLKPLTFNPDLDKPFVRCFICDKSEYEGVGVNDNWEFGQMYQAEDGTIYCEGCKVARGD